MVFRGWARAVVGVTSDALVASLTSRASRASLTSRASITSSPRRARGRLAARVGFGALSMSVASLATAACIGVTFVGCSEGEGAALHDDAREAPVGSVASALTERDPLSRAVTESCVTSSVRGLANQLVDEIQCLAPMALESLEGREGITLGATVFPFLQTPAAEALFEARADRGKSLVVNSALRTIAQQYLLFHWYKEGRCGIQLAAEPGKSNHESGLAIDVDDSANWRSTLEAHGFKWFGASDPVHFDFTAGTSSNLAGTSVLAFQRLWNRNHPDDPITEDGKYGSQTESRLADSPLGGFEKGADCMKPVLPEAGPVEAPPDAARPARDAGEITYVEYPPPSDEGCSASTHRARGEPGWAIAALGLTLAAWRRRRAARSDASRLGGRTT